VGEFGMVANLGKGQCLNRPAGSSSIKPTYFPQGKPHQGGSYRDVTARNKVFHAGDSASEA